MSSFIQTTFGKVNSLFPIVDFSKYVFFQEGPGLRKWQWTDNGMKVINVTNIIGDGSIDISNTNRFISQSEFETKYSHFAIEADDILIASSGNTYGKVGRIRIGQLPVMMNTSVIRLHPQDSPNLSFNYLYAYVRSPLFRNQIEQFVIGSAQPNFGPYHLNRMKLVLPEYQIQEKIAAIVSSYDNIIENNTRRIRILEEMAQAIYREWFVNFRFPGHEGMRMVESELGPVPEGWEIVPVTEAVIINPKITLTKEGIKPFLSMGCLKENTMNVQSIEYRDGNSGSKFQNGDTLFARITPCLENGKTVFIQFLPTDTDIGFGSTEFIVLRSKTLTPEFVYLLSRTDSFRDNAIRSMSGATGRQRVQEKCFEKYLIAHPDEKTLKAFKEIEKPFFKAVYYLANKSAILRRTRDLLLPKLISGEIDVSELDIKIPEAEV